MSVNNTVARTRSAPDPPLTPVTNSSISSSIGPVSPTQSNNVGPWKLDEGGLRGCGRPGIDHGREPEEGWQLDRWMQGPTGNRLEERSERRFSKYRGPNGCVSHGGR